MEISVDTDALLLVKGDDEKSIKIEISAGKTSSVGSSGF
jgi:hypothetical protein